jgi:hypothetical protein
MYGMRAIASVDDPTDDPDNAEVLFCMWRLDEEEDGDVANGAKGGSKSESSSWLS